MQRKCLGRLKVEDSQIVLRPKMMASQSRLFKSPASILRDTRPTRTLTLRLFLHTLTQSAAARNSVHVTAPLLSLHDATPCSDTRNPRCESQNLPGPKHGLFAPPPTFECKAQHGTTWHNEYKTKDRMAAKALKRNQNLPRTCLQRCHSRFEQHFSEVR